MSYRTRNVFLPIRSTRTTTEFLFFYSKSKKVHTTHNRKKIYVKNSFQTLTFGRKKNSWKYKTAFLFLLRFIKFKLQFNNNSIFRCANETNWIASINQITFRDEEKKNKRKKTPFESGSVCVGKKRLKLSKFMQCTNCDGIGRKKKLCSSNAKCRFIDFSALR